MKIEEKTLIFSYDKNVLSIKICILLGLLPYFKSHHIVKQKETKLIAHGMKLINKGKKVNFV